MPDVSGVVLAGGRSRRLGTNKAFVEVGGEALISRVLGLHGQLSDDLLIVTNEPAAYSGLGARVVEDVEPGAGALGGIYSGLLAARYERALVTGCDMPFLNLGLLRYMILLSADYDAVVPNIDGMMEPLHAVYSKACLKPIEAVLQSGGRRVAGFFDHVRLRYVGPSELDLFDPMHLSFFNINTPEDLARAQELAAAPKRR